MILLLHVHFGVKYMIPSSALQQAEALDLSQREEVRLK
ncbi:hypothetical protein AVDCRST_MAG81-1439 [uncultured Synechococcales cyanobacterium]|uniref:Uncharacterized protein n=1 Tax=uncultured Synechococcales cyanobacterium TaxID=1936017 RepID=A0A6J4V7U9_9CYAN|nr:hypothetical protein AVDCRST_MAG81-1439 [uncultured Synechococcales cyanobacterium]